MNGTDLDSELLQEFGGVSKNNLLNILNEQDVTDEIATHSPAKYVDLDTIETFIKNNKNSFSIFSVNIQSLNAKFGELTSLIKFLDEKYRFHFSAICLQETWLDDITEEIKKSSFEIPGYKIFDQGKQCSTKGGLITYVHEEFKGTKRKIFKKSNKKLWEGQSIIISGDRLKKKLCISNVYRPPRCNNNNYTITDFIDEFNPHIEKLESGTVQNIILGDFNIDLLQLQHREKFEEYFDKFISSGYIPKITLPTRFSEKKCNLIDQIYCNFDNPTQKCDSAILVSNLTDHLPCILAYEISEKIPKHPKYITITDKSEENKKKYIDGLVQDLENLAIDETPSNNPNIAYNKIDEILRSNHQKYFPQKSIRFNKYRHKINPWIEKDTLQSIKTRDKLYVQLKKTKIGTDDFYTKKRNLSTLNAIIKKNIRENKKSYYEREFAKYSGDCKKTWSTISTVLNRKTKKRPTPIFPK